jgi:hypothetical protein
MVEEIVLFLRGLLREFHCRAKFTKLPRGWLALMFNLGRGADYSSCL